MTNTKEDKEIVALLSKGADERIFTDKNGLNKYGVQSTNEKIINRGSCTCSVPDKESFKQIKKIYNSINDNDNWIEQNDQIFDNLKELINEKNEDNFELFLAPSGTDLVYIPLLIALITNPEKKILNITTCIEELGSGTRHASKGKYYAAHNQFGEKVEKGERILDKANIKTYFCKARCEKGEIIDNQKEIIDLANKHKDHTIVINLVYGSKSGIEDNLDLIDKIHGANIFWNTDLCQFRHNKTIIKKLIDKNSTVMITGSKFYQCPPFCAAMLIPKAIFNKIKNSYFPDEIKNFNSVFSLYDFPSELRKKLDLRNEINPSRILKWKHTIREITKFNKIQPSLIQEKINNWRRVVINLLKEKNEVELMPLQENTNKTIISFRLKHNEVYLNEQKLRKLHYLTTTKEYDNLGEGFSMVFIGQPVTYYNDKSFLRLAIGSMDIRKFVEDDEKDFAIDKRIVDILINTLKTEYENL